MDDLDATVRRALTEAELRGDDPEWAIPHLVSAIEALLEVQLRMQAEIANLHASREPEPAGATSDHPGETTWA